MSTMQLYRHPLSGHSHRVELLLSMLGIDADLIDVDLPNGEQKTARFLQLNPDGQVPVLDDHGAVVTDSNAILVYLATRYDPSRRWLPVDPRAAAEVQRVLTQTAGPLVQGPANARLITLFGASYDAVSTIAAAHKFLASLENRLANREWVAIGQPTIADLALYGYIAHAPEGNVSLADYPAVRRWLGRVEQLPGFVPMQKTAVGLAA